MNSLAPIVLFTYKRIETLKKNIAALSSSILAKESDLIVYSDGGKNDFEEIKIKEVRAFLKTINGFKSVTIHESPVNKGLAASIISGVSEVMLIYKKAIVLEDDLIISRNFLVFMNQGLDYYQNDPRILSISGYSPTITGLKPNDVYFTHRACSWGWATWEDKWKLIDWNCSNYEEFAQDDFAVSKFNKMGSDLSRMLNRQMRGKINSWAIRFCYNQFRKGLFSIHPAVSKVVNIGFSADATNTKMTHSPYETKLDDSRETNFKFTTDIKIENSIIQQFTRPFSIPVRIKYKLFNMLTS